MEIADRSDTIYIISPFLMESFDRVIQDFKNKGVKEVHLVTTLNVDANIQRKVNALHSFCMSCTAAGIKHYIYEDAALHGKIYIGTLDGEFSYGMLTSANFTNKGLYTNHEWGLWIEDKITLRALKDEVFNMCSKPLTNEDIFGIKKKVDDYFKKKPDMELPKIELTIKEFIKYKKKRPVDLQRNRLLQPNNRYVIKPVATTKDPYKKGRKPNVDIEITHVSDDFVKYINDGAFLILYGIGSGKILGLFEVLFPPVYTGEGAYPWAITTRNLYSNYSENWYSFEKIRSRTKREYPEGIKTLNLIQWGRGAIPVDEKFGKYLISIIKEGNE